jgi:hypothetical protein
MRAGAAQEDVWGSQGQGRWFEKDARLVSRAVCKWQGVSA